MEPLTIIIVAVIIIFPILLVKEAKKQKKTSIPLFENYAKSHNWTYMQEDDGTVQNLAKDLQGIGRFNSPSLGKIAPENVIIGSVPKGRIHYFQHHVRISEGNAIHLNVCLLQLKNTICDALIVRFKKESSRLTNELYTMPELELDQNWSKDVVIYGNYTDINEVLDDITLTKIVEKANELPWRIDLQIKNNLVAVYIAERNASVENESDLSALKDFTEYVAGSIQR
ncbi:hypothetical protein [Methanococcoides sp. LMO-2]|uniref:Uncharacterized protein n=1 Tax=Methanococcoides cohabitans TaxID=3136559 RepID=A0ABU9KSH8_9EURY